MPQRPIGQRGCPAERSRGLPAGLPLARARFRHLRAQARDDMGEQRPPAKRQQRLVAAAHAARFAAGKHDADHASR
jgi:hypothetical protein